MPFTYNNVCICIGYMPTKDAKKYEGVIQELGFLTLDEELTKDNAVGVANLYLPRIREKAGIPIYGISWAVIHHDGNPVKTCSICQNKDKVPRKIVSDDIIHINTEL